MKKILPQYVLTENSMASKRVRLNPTVRRIISIIAVVYIALCIVLYFFQRDLLYFPTPEINHSYKTISLKSGEETLQIIVLNEGKSNALIYFGGNNEAVANQAQEHSKDFANQTVYLANYRGYGGSTGTPTEDGLYEDALVLFDYVQKKHTAVSVMGRSLGTGVATYVAVNRLIHKLILVTPYDSIEAIAKSQYPLFPISLLLKDSYDSESRAPFISVPTLIVVAGKDSLIPADNTLNLVRAFRPKTLEVTVFKNAGHGDVSHLQDYHELLANFIMD